MNKKMYITKESLTLLKEEVIQDILCKLYVIGVKGIRFDIEESKGNFTRVFKLNNSYDHPNLSYMYERNTTNPEVIKMWNLLKNS